MRRRSSRRSLLTPFGWSARRTPVLENERPLSARFLFGRGAKAQCAPTCSRYAAGRRLAFSRRAGGGTAAAAGEARSGRGIRGLSDHAENGLVGEPGRRACRATVKAVAALVNSRVAFWRQPCPRFASPSRKTSSAFIFRSLPSTSVMREVSNARCEQQRSSSLGFMERIGAFGPMRWQSSPANRLRHHDQRARAGGVLFTVPFSEAQQTNAHHKLTCPPVRLGERVEGHCHDGHT